MPNTTSPADQLDFRIGDIATVEVDGQSITGRVYYINPRTGWAAVETLAGRIASGPPPRKEQPMTY